MVIGLDRDPAPCLAAVRHCKEVLAEANFHPPDWRDLAVVVPERAEEEEPNQPKFGWQQCASRSLKTKFLNERVWPVTILPTTREKRMDGQPVRVLVLPCRPAPAGVAANLIQLATIAQRVLRQGCSVGGVSH